MDVYEAINRRRTIRDFKDQIIPMEIAARILDAGLKAPTNNHMRSWEFIVITDKEEKAKVISHLVRTETKEAAESFVDNYNMTDPVREQCI